MTNDDAKAAVLAALLDMRLYVAGREDDSRAWSPSDLATDLAPAVLAFAEGAVTEALRAGLRGLPVELEGRGAKIVRRLEECDVLTVYDVCDLLAIAGHLQAQAAALMNDDAGYVMGLAHGRAEAGRLRRENEVLRAYKAKVWSAVSRLGPSAEQDVVDWMAESLEAP